MVLVNYMDVFEMKNKRLSNVNIAEWISIVKGNHIEEVKRLVSIYGIQIVSLDCFTVLDDYKEPHKVNAIKYVSYKSLISMLKFFLSKTKAKCITASWFYFGHTESYKQTLVVSKYKLERNPLHWGVLRENIEAIKLLLRCPSIVNARDEYKQTPLHYAAKICHPNIVELLSDKALIDSRDIHKRTPLHYASWECQRISLPSNENLATTLNASTKRCAVVTQLLRHGAVVNVLDNKRNTTLHYACRTDQVEIVEILVSNKVQVNSQNNNGCTALHIACQGGNVSTVKYLMQHGVNVNITNKQGITAIDMVQGQNGHLFNDIFNEQTEQRPHCYPSYTIPNIQLIDRLQNLEDKLCEQQEELAMLRNKIEPSPKLCLLMDKQEKYEDLNVMSEHPAALSQFIKDEINRQIKNIENNGQKVGFNDLQCIKNEILTYATDTFERRLGQETDYVMEETQRYVIAKLRHLLARMSDSILQKSGATYDVTEEIDAEFSNFDQTNENYQDEVDTFDSVSQMGLESNERYGEVQYHACNKETHIHTPTGKPIKEARNGNTMLTVNRILYHNRVRNVLHSSHG